MEKNKQIKWGIVLQYIQMALNIIIQLLYTPIMLKILGKNEYGIYNIASSMISYLSLLSLGFGASYIRFYTKYKVEEDEEGIKRLNGLYLIVFSFIGIIALVLGLVLSVYSNNFFNDTYTYEELKIAKILLIFLTINLSVSFPASVFVSYITSQEQFIFQKLINIGKTVLAPAVSIILLYFGYGSIGMVIITTTISLLVDFINVFYCIIKLKMRFSFKKLEFSLLKNIFLFSIFIAINEVINQINWQTDKIILGKIATASSGAVAVYAIGANINTMYVQFSTAISNVFTPKIHRIVAENNDDTDQKLTLLLTKVGRIQFFVLFLILSGFVFFGQFFILKWAGEGFDDAYYIVLLLIIPVTIPLIQNVGIEIQRAKNKHQFRSIVYLIMAIINVGISIVLCFKWGAIGCALGTAISLLIANFIIMNIYYQKKLGLNMVFFWKSIMKIIPSLIIPIGCGILIYNFISYDSLWQFGLLIILYSFVYFVSIFFIGFNQDEKKFFRRIILRKNV